MQERVDQGVVSHRELMALELQIAQAQADATTIGLELEEIRSAGREPLGELSSPLVDGRDFVSERIRASMQVARRRVDVVQQAREWTRQRVDLGVVSARELQAQDLAVLEAERHVAILAEQLDIRRAYLDSEITAVEAELKLLELEAQNQVILMERRRQQVRTDVERVRGMVEVGAVHPVEATQMEMVAAEIDAELRLAQQELEIVRRELERRTQR
jgi:outer membrane protein TolC